HTRASATSRLWNFDGSAKQWYPTHPGRHLSRNQWSEGSRQVKAIEPDFEFGERLSAEYPLTLARSAARAEAIEPDFEFEARLSPEYPLTLARSAARPAAMLPELLRDEPVPLTDMKYPNAGGGQRGGMPPAVSLFSDSR
ncbi:hypothetical protein, partial [Myxococcus sp. CA051A]|uniref:hypothetical protein n=1 Tax=Myxococcus sp. CA051A TaxID=2741739 RepID=UPI001C2CD242